MYREVRYILEELVLVPTSYHMITGPGPPTQIQEQSSPAFSPPGPILFKSRNEAYEMLGPDISTGG